MRTFLYAGLLSLLLASCHNKDVTYPDYQYNAVYFPLQYPLRTLVLGDSRSDNSLDKNLQFHIGVSIGGLYQNSTTWNVDYQVDPSLVPDNLTLEDGTPVKMLPSHYYTLSPEGTVTIPSGSFNGLILVQLTDDFLDDPLAVSANYVIPLRITGTNADSILTGVPAVSDPNKNVAADWDANALPRDFVLFGIKFINPYHGSYLHRGKDVTLDDGGNEVSSVVYHQQYVENDQLWKLTTTGRNSVQTDGIGSKYDANTKMTLNVDNEGNVQVQPVSSSTLKASGVGRYVKDAEEWGGEKHPAFYLNYLYKDGTVNHVVTDTLVFRDNGVVFEQLSVKVN